MPPFSPAVPGRRRFLATLAGTLAGSAFPASAADPSPLRLSVAVGPAFALGDAARTWADALNAAGPGMPVVRVHPGATLARRDPGREFAVLAEGGADLAVGSSLAWSAQVPALAVASLPFIAPTWEQLAALATGELHMRLAEAVAAAGVVMLALAPLGHREILVRGGPVATPAEAAGLRVRVTPMPVVQDFFTALEARAVALPFAAARDAFRDGALDAQEGPPQTFAAAHLDALGLKHVTVWGAMGELAVLAAHRGTWERLDASTQAYWRATAVQVAAALGPRARAEGQAALDTLWGRGVAVTRLSPASRADLAAAVAPMHARWSATIGADLAALAQRITAALR